MKRVGERCTSHYGYIKTKKPFGRGMNGVLRERAVGGVQVYMCEGTRIIDILYTYI